MSPFMKRRTPESPLLQGSQENDGLDLELAVQSDQTQDVGSVPLSWGPSHSRGANIEAQSVQDAAKLRGMEESTLSSRVLVQDTIAPVLEASDVSISQEIALTASGTSQPLSIHISKGKLQPTGSRRGKKISGRPGPVSQEDRDDPSSTPEPFSGEPSEEIAEDGGKPLPMLSGGELPSLSVANQSAKPGSQLWELSPLDVGVSPQEQLLRAPAPHVEDETEEGGLFIPTEEQDNEDSEKRRKKKKGTKRKREGRGHEEGTLNYDLKLGDMLDRTLEDGAKQHNLTAVNVRNILHEVITNEHVVAMMKAAISETEDMPMFEPKMTRSKLKEVVEKGVAPGMDSLKEKEGTLRRTTPSRGITAGDMQYFSGPGKAQEACLWCILQRKQTRAPQALFPTDLRILQSRGGEEARTPREQKAGPHAAAR